MISEAKSVSWKETDSVLEALILEANLIKKHQPKYNSRDKDNKSFNYLVITREDFPRVLVVRGRELFGGSPLATGYLRRNRGRFRRDFCSLEYQGKNRLPAIYGPYPQGCSLKDALKIVRKIFPFRDKCLSAIAGSDSEDAKEGAPLDISTTTLLSKPRELDNKEKQKMHGKGCRPCFNRQIGLCPGVCSGEMGEEEYSRTIKNIKELFSGNFHGLKQRLTREMREASKFEHFEKAIELRRQISALEHIRDVALIKDENRFASGGQVNMRKEGNRIEAYDVAHTSGSETVAVMAVVNNGEPEKESYRKFRIKTAKNDDVAALREVLSRRLMHNKWPLPRVFVVDGGAAQLRAAVNVLKDASLAIPVVAVVKNQFHKPERMLGAAKAIEACGNEILLANQEAHRFAIAYHRKRMYIFR